MSYFQKHLKTVSSQNQDPFARSSITNSQCVNKFKKHIQNKSKVSQANTVDEPIRPNRRNQHEEQPLTEYNPKIIKPARREEQKIQQKPRGEKQHPIQFATQNQNNHCQSDSMSKQLQTLMMDADNSMEQLLNSSINQFTRYLEDKDNFYQQHNQLIEQNHCLKASLDELKNILKSKLQSALQKQKEELTVMMEDYIKLITKLLKDKEELTVNLEDLEAQLKQTEKRCNHWQRQTKQTKKRMEQLTREKDDHISKTKKQIDDFLQIIDQYEEQADHEGKENEQMRAKIEELQQELKRVEEEGYGSQNKNQNANQKISQQSHKIQTLIELLERSQQENKVLRESLHKISQSDDKLTQLQQEYKQRLEEIQKQHEEEFMQYEKAVQETMNKKNECIERLNSIIDGYRSKRSNLECSMQTTARCN